MLIRSLLIGAPLALSLSACSKPAAQSADTGAPLNAVRVPMPASEPMPGPPAPDAKAGWSTYDGGATARYGFPGRKPLLVLACRTGHLIVTRTSPAEVGAEALFALIGNKAILRLPVSAINPPGERGYIWQGMFLADDPRTDVFMGAEFTGTLPGGGKITVPGSDIARQAVHKCRSATPPADAESTAAPAGA